LRCVEIFRSRRARLLAKPAEIPCRIFGDRPLWHCDGPARLGETDATYASLEKAYQQRSTEMLYWIQTEPAFDRLRSEPRFQDLLRKTVCRDKKTLERRDLARRQALRIVQRCATLRVTGLAALLVLRGRHCYSQGKAYFRMFNVGVALDEVVALQIEGRAVLQDCEGYRCPTGNRNPGTPSGVESFVCVPLLPRPPNCRSRHRVRPRLRR